MRMRTSRGGVEEEDRCIVPSFAGQWVVPSCAGQLASLVPSFAGQGVAHPSADVRSLELRCWRVSLLSPALLGKRLLTQQRADRPFITDLLLGAFRAMVSEKVSRFVDAER